MFWGESIIVPDFTISVHSSSCNSLLLKVFFLFSFFSIYFLAFHSASGKPTSQVNAKGARMTPIIVSYMNCRKQNDKIRSIRLATGLYLHMSTLKWNSGNSAPRWYGLSQVILNLWLSLDQLIISITKLKIALIHNVQYRGFFFMCMMLYFCSLAFIRLIR